jgi:hypothetical protein
MAMQSGFETIGKRNAQREGSACANVYHASLDDCRNGSESDKTRCCLLTSVASWR